MKAIFHKTYRPNEVEITKFVNQFDTMGKPFGKIGRNAIRLFDFEGKIINIKSFKIPNIFNQIAYGLFRKSKARRSFEYANILLDLGIGTPHPIAYFERSKMGLFKNSFYVSEHFECDLTYRELIHNTDYPDYENILRAFTRFTFKLHENGVNFLDHSPGNTLIKKTSNGYEFYLVDLNRMAFGAMDFNQRMKNFAKLTKFESMVEIMSDEYAQLIDVSYAQVFDKMWYYNRRFWGKRERKERVKALLLGR